MKRYSNKIVLAVIVLVIGVLAINVDFPQNIISYVRNVKSEAFLADSCVTGTGTTYYINSDNVGVHNTPSTDASTVISQLNKCTTVTVYCGSGNFKKISKATNKWVSATYLSESKPSECSNTYTTTTDKITFTLGTPTLTPAPTFDKMYADKDGKITLVAQNIQNVATDDNNLFFVNIKYGTTDVTNKFIIEKTDVVSGKMTITIKMLSGSYKYDAGTYSIEVTAGATTTKKNFELVQNYYDFKIAHTLTTNYENTPTNRENNWDIVLTKDGIPNNNGFTLKVLKGTTDVTSKFNQTLENDTFKLSNKTDNKFNRPTPGKYTVEISYYDDTVSNSRGTIKRTFEIDLGSRAITFEQNKMISHRYIRTKLNLPYDIEIYSIGNGTNPEIKFYEKNGDTKDNKTMRLSEFETIYSDFNISIIQVINNKPVYRHNELCTITRYYNKMVTYVDVDGVTHTVNEDEFKVNYAAAFSAFLNTIKAGSSTYTFTLDANGYLQYTRAGIKVVDNKQLSTEIKEIIATAGGEYNYTIAYENLIDEDFENAIVKFYKQNDEAKDQYIDIEKDKSFKFEWEHDKDNIYIKVIYDNTDEAKYVGSYYVTIDFPDVATQKIGFAIYDGDIDFYLTSQVDPHLDSEYPLSDLPPGNQRYEYYLGFYLMKSGKILDYKSAENITVSIFDHYVDLDTNGDLFYYNQIDYEARIIKYINNEVTYQLVDASGNLSAPITATKTNFEKNYYHVAELLNKYKYNADGTIITNQDNYELHITSFTTDTSIADMVVEFYTTDSTKKTKMALTDFKVKYPDMYGKLVTRFVFTSDGNIIVGAIRGSYRVTEENGSPIVGNDITDQFDITIDYENPKEIEKAITVLPKTEVKAGTYYVYVSYDQLPGIGYVNNAPDAIINRYEYPEMWQQNIHMTKIKYKEAKYNIELREPKLANTGNNLEKMYYNKESSATFDVPTEFIYDFKGISYNIQYNNGTSWVNANDHFTVINKIGSNQSQIILNNVVGKSKTGNYRLTVTYTNNGQVENRTQEFSITGKYYGLSIENISDVKFIHNFREEKIVNVLGEFVNTPANIVPSIKRIVDGINDETLTRDATTFKNKKGEVVFNYYVDYETDGSTLSNYHFHITNVKDVTVIGNYELTFSYYETGHETTTTVLDFEVQEDQYYLQFTDYTAKAGIDNTTITFDLETQYIDAVDLDKIRYTVYYYDKRIGEYVDVSSDTSANKMFDITSVWDTSKPANCTAKVIVALNEEVDWDGGYYIEAAYRTTNNDDSKNVAEMEFPQSLRDLFAWSIKKVNISALYQESYTDDDGNFITKDIILDKFYSNVAETQVVLDIESVHENDVNWTINQECLEETCDPTSGTNYNDRFEAINETGTNKKLTLKLKPGMSLPAGKYAITLYYTNSDYKVYELVVYDKYVNIEFDDALVYSDKDNGTTISGLYNNLNGHVYLPMNISGVGYDEVTVRVTDLNGTTDYSTYFSYNKEDFIAKKVLELVYNKTSKVIAQDYLITVQYETSSGIIYDTLAVSMNSAYFDFNVENPVYNPNPIYPNVIGGGDIAFRVNTENIDNITNGPGGETATKKHIFAQNTTVKDENNNDVTTYFTITANNIDASIFNDFNLNLHFEQGKIEPGLYTMTTYFGEGTRIVRRTKEFVIGDYLKTFNIGKVETITNTKDGKIHRNLGGTYRLNYMSEFVLDASAIKVKVFSSDNIDVTNAFDIHVYSKYIDVKLVAKEPYLLSGNYRIQVSYQDSDTYPEYVQNINVFIAGTYKDITISNMNTDSSIIYADKDNQYYTFDVDTSALSASDITSLKARIYDETGKLVYSDITSDNVTNNFEVLNNLTTADNNYRINILPFKAQTGYYTIALYLEDENGEYNVSNELEFNIQSKFYRVRLGIDSTITPKVVYGADRESMYDIDGAHANFLFTSNYGSDLSVYSIKLMRDGEVVKELKNISVNNIEYDGIKYLNSEFDIPAMEYGEYQVALCLNGLEYASMPLILKQYIKVTKVSVFIGDNEVTDAVKMYAGETENMYFKYEPTNATNPDFVFSIADTSVATINGSYITILKEGSTNLILSGKDLTKNITLTTEERLMSNVYKVTYGTNAMIYVNSMTSMSLTKQVFMSNLKNVVPDYKILNKAGKDITATVTKIGTGMTIVNGKEKYVISIIGDLNGDGNINVSDVAYLFQYVKGRTTIKDAATLKAADIRKINNINIGDVAKLFQFIKGRTNKL